MRFMPVAAERWRAGIYSVTIGAWVRPFGVVHEVQNAIVFKVASVASDGVTTFNVAGNPACSPIVNWRLEEAACVDNSVVSRG